MMKFSVLILSVVLSLFSACTLLGSNGNPTELVLHDENAIDILFIGSSYFNYNYLPDLMKNLFDQKGKNVNIYTAITNGLFLSDHANLSSTASKIKEKNWNYVVLQGVGRQMAYPDIFTDHPAYSSLQTLRDKISANFDSTKIVFCMPWAFEDGMVWQTGWTDEYTEMQQKIYDNTLEYAGDIGFIISPVGRAWNSVLEENNFPLHYLHMSDWNHPSLRGSYLMACVVYSTLFQESTVDIEYYVGIPEDEAKHFQEVASSTVLDSLELWNIK